MAAWANRCEGTDEAVVTTTNTNGPDQFSAVNASPVFDTAQAAHGLSAIRVDTTTSAAKYVRWTFGSVKTHQAGRGYLRLSAAPAADGSFIQAQDAAGTGNFRIQIRTTRVLRVQNSAGTTLATGTVAIPLNQWVRVYYEADTNGSWTVKLYTDAASTTPAETLSGTAASLGSDLQRVQWGLSGGGANWPSTWIDSLYVSDTAGDPGPYTGAGGAIGQAAETGTAQPAGRSKTRAAGQGISAETAPPAGRAKSKTPAQVVESDTGPPVARAKARAVVQAAEADVATATSRVKARAAGFAAGVELAQPTGRSKARAVGQVVGAATALALGRRKTRGVNGAVEADTGQQTGRQKARSAATAVEYGAAQPVARSKFAALAQAGESATACAADRGKALVAAQAAEIGTAQGVGSSKAVPHAAAHGITEATPPAAVTASRRAGAITRAGTEATVRRTV